MSKYNDRRWEIQLDDQVFIAETPGRQFRVVFNILIDYGGFNSYCDIAIYNLSESTAAKAFKKGVVLGFKAGYKDSIDFLFKGTIKNSFKERSGPDTITRIIARGGSQSLDKTINETIGKESTIVDILTAVTTAMGYPLIIQSDDFSDVPAYIRGYVMFGDPRTYLNQLAQTHDFSWVIDNERVVITRNNSFRLGTPVIISESTGMEGIPEVSEIGCDVNVRLNSKIKIGGRIDVQSKLRTFNFSNLYFVDVPASAGVGIYRVFKLNHTGDSWGDPWTTGVTSVR